jgi:peptidoglycan/xylan/chitin deacetylase (PgdA/CDA1 family)
MYFVKTPFWLKKLFKAYTWHVNTANKELYLTFDDGPHPVATPFVLEQLTDFNAKASFFCLGKNVVEYPAIYQDIMQRGHTVGNHTHNHLNGWKTSHDVYVDNVYQASAHIVSDFFRPPYGRISNKAGKTLRKKGFDIIMWDVLSGDFDQSLSPENCKRNVVEKAGSGSIIVFHDSEKAFPNLKYALPSVLEYFGSQGFIFKGLADN